MMRPSHWATNIQTLINVNAPLTLFLYAIFFLMIHIFLQFYLPLLDGIYILRNYICVLSRKSKIALPLQ